MPERVDNNGVTIAFENPRHLADTLAQIQAREHAAAHDHVERAVGKRQPLAISKTKQGAVMHPLEHRPPPGTSQRALRHVDADDGRTISCGVNRKDPVAAAKIQDALAGTAACEHMLEVLIRTSQGRNHSSGPAGPIVAGIVDIPSAPIVVCLLP